MSGVSVAVWADELGLVSGLERRGGMVTVARVCEDLPEVLATLATGVAQIALLAGPSTLITSAFIDAAARVGGRCVILSDDPREHERLARLGVTGAAYTADPDLVAQAVMRAAHPGAASPPTTGLWAPDPGQNHVPDGAGTAAHPAANPAANPAPEPGTASSPNVDGSRPFGSGPGGPDGGGWLRSVAPSGAPGAGGTVQPAVRDTRGARDVGRRGSEAGGGVPQAGPGVGGGVTEFPLQESAPRAMGRPPGQGTSEHGRRAAGWPGSQPTPLNQPPGAAPGAGSVQRAGQQPAEQFGQRTGERVAQRTGRRWWRRRDAGEAPFSRSAPGPTPPPGQPQQQTPPARLWPTGGGQGKGRITVVWGTGGAPGRSTVALNMAVELALNGASVALVDADSYGASLASMLGLLDETAGLVRLCRLVEAGNFQAEADSAASARVDVAGASLRFTSGLPRPERWAELSAQAVARALAALASAHDEVVVDIAAPVGRDDELALDSFAPQRNDAANAALEAADRVFVVGRADAVGLPRLIRLCEEAVQRPGSAPVVVMNQLRAQAAGPRPEQALRVAWRRFGPIALMPKVYLPWDPVAADASLLQGSALAEAAPRSPLRLALREWALSDAVTAKRGGRSGQALRSASPDSSNPSSTPPAHSPAGRATG